MAHYRVPALGQRQNSRPTLLRWGPPLPVGSDVAVWTGACGAKGESRSPGATSHILKLRSPGGITTRNEHLVLGSIVAV